MRINWLLEIKIIILMKIVIIKEDYQLEENLLVKEENKKLRRQIQNPLIGHYNKIRLI